MSPEAIEKLLATRMDLHVDVSLAGKLSVYLDLLLRWNARTNLTAIRDPESTVLRHFGESLQCAQAIPAGARTLLDYGSGGGFPGALCALLKPELAVTLGESQNKKAAFLQELCRTLELRATVHAGRVESMPPALQFGAVTLRAVDHMEEACLAAKNRVRAGGWLVLMTTDTAWQALAPRLAGMVWAPLIPLRGSEQGVVALGQSVKVSSCT